MKTLFAALAFLAWAPCAYAQKLGLDEDSSPVTPRVETAAPKPLALPAPPPPNAADRALQLQVPERRSGNAARYGSDAAGAVLAAIGIVGTGYAISNGYQAFDAKRACVPGDAACAAEAHNRGDAADYWLAGGLVALGVGAGIIIVTEVVTAVKNHSNQPGTKVARAE